MRRITLGLGLNLLLLSATATLLTNLVVLPFWISDAQVREAGLLRRLLDAGATASTPGATDPPAMLRQWLADQPAHRSDPVHWPGRQGDVKPHFAGIREKNGYCA